MRHIKRVGASERQAMEQGGSTHLDQRILHLLSQHLERGGLSLGHGCRPVGRARGRENDWLEPWAAEAGVGLGALGPGGCARVERNVNENP
jgi:hypothetical protein